MQEPIHAKSMSNIPMAGKVPGAHLSRFLALAGYRGREGIVDSKWHLLLRMNALYISIFCDFLTKVKARLWDLLYETNSTELLRHQSARSQQSQEK